MEALPEISERDFERSNMTNKKLGIIGTGSFARALAKRALKSNYEVALGSRDPVNRNLSSIDQSLVNAEVVSISECIQFSELIVVAIHRKSFRESLEAFKEQFSMKMIVDVSNNPDPKTDVSNAAFLQGLLPGGRVVKGFNVLSSWGIESESFGGSKEVYFCGDDNEAKMAAMQLSRDMGFHPVDCGGLASAREIEAIPLRLFPGWLGPTVFAWVVFAVFFLWAIVRNVWRPNVEWSNMPLRRLNPAVCTSSLFILACCYLPGLLAAFFHLWLGNKHERFPAWLDQWLKARRELGVWAFFFATAHVIMSLAVLMPGNFRSWYSAKTVKLAIVNSSTPIEVFLSYKFNWIGESVLLAGTVSYLVMCLLAITTLPPVGSALNWREWAFVQSMLGYVCFAMAVVHVLLYGGPFWFKREAYYTIRSFTFLASLLPLVVLFLKALLLLPCLSVPLWRIRNGRETSSPWLRGKRAGDTEIQMKDV